MTVLRTNIFGLMLALMLLSACRTAPVVMDIVDAPVRSDKASLAMDDVEVAIKRAGSGLGWVMLSDAPGKMTGTLRLRSHVAVVGVTYDTSTYSIQYKESTNLDYDAAKGTIHPNYNGWIQNLDNAIQRELAALM